VQVAQVNTDFLDADFADYAESLATERSRGVFISRTTGKEGNSANFVDFSGRGV
jgi:hypothetical protein